jgi:hypothetical protein
VCKAVRGIRVCMYRRRVQVVSLGRFFVGLLILLLYLASAGTLVYFSYKLSPPTTPDQWKEFGVRAGIALTAVATFVGMIVTLFTLATQINAAKALEIQKGQILEGVEGKKNELQRKLEEYKSDLQEEIEKLKGRISRQNEFLSRTLDVKTQAYNELFKASAVCYSELQYLARGEFDKKEVRASEKALIIASGLEANLDDEDREIVRSIIQKVYDIIDLAWDVKKTGEERKAEYERIWNENVGDFGAAFKALQDRSLFYNKSTKID